MSSFKILGHPLQNFILEPVMNAAFEALGMEDSFACEDVALEAFPEWKAKLQSGEVKGIFMMDPFKSPSVEWLTEVPQDIQVINAVNFVSLQNGKIQGWNLNAQGAMDCILAAMPSLKDVEVLILGAGGAGRAAAYILAKMGAQVSIWNRTGEKAKAFVEGAKAAGLQMNWVEELNHFEGRPQILINATAMGDSDRQTSLAPYPVWEKVEVAMDAVYGKTSLFLEQALAAQVPHLISGEEWFLSQAVALFKRLTPGLEKPVPVDVMEAALKLELEAI